MVDWDKQFFDRRRAGAASSGPASKSSEAAGVSQPEPGRERRQFADSRDALRPEIREFADAVDAYKISRARKFVTLEELYQILVSLGYHK